MKREIISVLRTNDRKRLITLVRFFQDFSRVFVIAGQKWLISLLLELAKLKKKILLLNSYQWRHICNHFLWYLYSCLLWLTVFWWCHAKSWSESVVILKNWISQSLLDFALKTLEGPFGLVQQCGTDRWSSLQDFTALVGK